MALDHRLLLRLDGAIDILGQHMSYVIVFHQSSPKALFRQSFTASRHVNSRDFIVPSRTLSMLPISSYEKSCMSRRTITSRKSGSRASMQSCTFCCTSCLSILSRTVGSFDGGSTATCPSSVRIGSSMDTGSWQCLAFSCFSRFFERLIVMAVSQVRNLDWPRKFFMFRYAETNASCTISRASSWLPAIRKEILSIFFSYFRTRDSKASRSPLLQEDTRPASSSVVGSPFCIILLDSRAPGFVPLSMLFRLYRKIHSFSPENAGEMVVVNYYL